jgi:DNA ligase-4
VGSVSLLLFPDLTVHQVGTRPHFHVYFTVSYGLSRAQLEEVNFLIKTSDYVSFSSLDNKQNSLFFTFTMYKGLRPPPSYVLRTPLLAELFGAGFTKAPASKHYELRFPRLSKVYRPSERSWTEGADLQAINAAACKSVGRIMTDENMDDWARNLFQINDSSHRPEKWSAPIDVWNENGPKPYKKLCYESSSSPLHQNRAGETQSTISIGLPSTVKISVAHKVSATEALTCSSNAQTSPAILFRDDVLETTTQAIKSPFLLQGYDLCWFAQPVSEGRQPCLFWTLWKRQIPRERRLHSLASFLAGCGWIESGTSGSAAQGKKRGVIVVDECDEACKASILDTLNHLQTSSLSSDGRAAIWVFGCRPSDIPLQLYQS